MKGYVQGNIFNRNHFFLRRFITTRRELSSYLFDSISIQNMPGRIIETFAVLGLFLLIVIAKWWGNDGGTLITVGAFMAAAYKIIPGIVKLINAAGQIRAYEFSVSDLVQSVGEETEKTRSSPVCLNSMELRNINFQYRDLPVLDNFHPAIILLHRPCSFR